MSSRQLDRVAGTMLGMACGDALGAPWEFGPPLGPEVQLEMTGGGSFRWAPGEWTDDTSMAIAILEALADRGDLADPECLDRVVERWAEWAQSATDVGAQTSAVLSLARELATATDPVTQPGLGRGPRRSAGATDPSRPPGYGSGASTSGRRSPAGPPKMPSQSGPPASSNGMRPPSGVPGALTAEIAVRAAREVHERSGRSGGNGSLMRTAPVALAELDAPDSDLAGAARRVSGLTHFDPQAGDACVLWCLAIRAAVRTGDINVRIGLPETAEPEFWAARIGEAEESEPAAFDQNGWVVQALQGAVAAIAMGTRKDPATPVVPGIEAAVRGGRDTDTVAAIAGALLGASCGASSLPSRWLENLHGWPGLDAAGLVGLTYAATGA